MTIVMTDGVERLLRLAGSFPIQQPERIRLIKALEMLRSTEWDRVVVKCESEHLKALSAGLSSPIQDDTDLELVLKVAQSIVQIYSFGAMDVPHIAVALAVTSKEQEATLDVIAEAFGLGHLEDSSEIYENFRRLEEVGNLESFQPKFENPEINAYKSSRFAQKIAPWANLLIRVISCVAILTIAARDDQFLLVFIGLAALVSSKDPRNSRPKDEENDAYRDAWMEPSLRWPWLAIPAIVGALYFGTEVSWIITIEYLLIEAIRVACLKVWARGVFVVNDSVLEHGLSCMKSASLPDRVILKRQSTILFLSVLALLFSVIISPIDSPIIFFICLLAIYARVVMLALSIAFISLKTGNFIMVPLLLFIVSLTGFYGAYIMAGQRKVSFPGTPFDFDPIWMVKPAAFLRVVQARRLIRKGVPHGAANILSKDGDPKTQGELLLLSWAWLQANEIGRASRYLSASGDKSRTHFGLLIGFMIATETRQSHMTSDEEQENSEERFGAIVTRKPELSWWIATAHFRRAKAVCSDDEMLVISRLFLDKVATLPDVGRQILALRMAAEACLGKMPWVSMMLLIHCRTIIHIGYGYGMRQYRDFAPVGAVRLLFVEEARVLSLLMEACTKMAEENDAFSDNESLGLESARWLGEMGLPLEAARVFGRFADNNESTVLYGPMAFDARLESISILNSMRHRIHDVTNRRIWWHDLGAAFGAAMSQATRGQDWRTLAELIESARLQFDDRNAKSIAEVPPFVMVRGESELAKTSWYDPSMTPPTYSLEASAEWVGGPDSCWWSSWIVDEFLYWAFVPPAGEIRGGVIDLDKSGISNTLRDLTAALPIRFTNEDDYEYETRMAESPLIEGPYDAEFLLSSRLSALVPSAVSEYCRGQMRGKLVLAPDPLLSVVPWAAVPFESLMDTRLVEKASIFIAPPISLIASVSRRVQHPGSFPISFAVVNPGGDLVQSNEVSALLPEAVAGNPSAGEWGTAWISQKLQNLPHQSTIVFAAHTDRADDSPSGLGILLSPKGEEPLELISAADFIENHADFPLPAQVVLFACDSSNLREVDAGEWLVLGPALLVAGATRTLVTSYPVIDVGAVDADLISRLIDSTANMQHALLDLQLEQLEQWREGNYNAAPIHWAGHTLLGGFAESPLELRDFPARLLRIQQSLTGLIDEVTGSAQSKGRAQADWWDVACALLGGGYMKDNFRSVALATVLILCRPRRSRRPHNSTNADTISAEIIDLLDRSSKIASRSRAHVVHMEHLVVAVLETEGRKGQFFRRITGLDPRLPEISKVMLSETNSAGYMYTSSPDFKHLSAESVETLYGALGAVVPKTDEPRFLAGAWKTSK